MEDLSKFINNLSQNEIDSIVSRLFYFNKTIALSESDNNWVPIPNSPITCFNILDFGDLDFDKNPVFSKNLEDLQPKLNTYSIKYSKVFTIFSKFDILNKCFKLYSNDSKIYHEMVTSFTSPYFNLPPNLIGIIFKLQSDYNNILENDNCIFKNLINSNTSDCESEEKIPYTVSIEYLKYQIAIMIKNLNCMIVETKNNYTEKELTITFSYLITSIIYNYTLNCFKISNFIIKNLIFKEFNLDIIKNFEINTNVTDLLIDNIIGKGYTSESYSEISLSVIIQNCSKYLKCMDNKTDLVSPLFNIDDIKFINFLVFKMETLENEKCSIDNIYGELLDRVTIFENEILTFEGFNEIKKYPLLLTVAYCLFSYDIYFENNNPELFKKYKSPDFNKIILDKTDTNFLMNLKIISENEIMFVFMYFVGKLFCYSEK